MKKKIAVLASGSGSNLQAIAQNIRDGKLNAEMAVVISDNASAFALTRAKKFGLKHVVIPKQKNQPRQAYDEVLKQCLIKHQVDLVVLAGFMRILSQPFVHFFKGKLINIHPSLLPAFPGLNALERAYAAKEKKMGVTVHFVDEGVDTGPIIDQRSILVEPNETLASVTDRIHSLEHEMYSKAIEDVLRGIKRYG